MVVSAARPSGSDAFENQSETGHSLGRVSPPPDLREPHLRNSGGPLASGGIVLPHSTHLLTALSIPSDHTIRRALLELASDGKIHRLLHAVDSPADRLDLTPAERNAKTPSSNKRFYDRVSFASLDLRRHDLLGAVGRGHFRITPRSETLLQAHPGPYPDSVPRAYGRTPTDG